MEVASNYLRIYYGRREKRPTKPLYTTLHPEARTIASGFLA
jgi:hypothetical protein